MRMVPPGQWRPRSLLAEAFNAVPKADLRAHIAVGADDDAEKKPLGCACYQPTTVALALEKAKFLLDDEARTTYKNVEQRDNSIQQHRTTHHSIERKTAFHHWQIA
jgi:hypothetical protein